MTPPQAQQDPDTHVSTLTNGVRVLVLQLPQLHTAHVSIFVRTGSQHESSRQRGISHMVEHMAFKGTHRRSCQRINLDAEGLGAEVNAHTDKDHSAFHLHIPESIVGEFWHPYFFSFSFKGVLKPNRCS